VLARAPCLALTIITKEGGENYASQEKEGKEKGPTIIGPLPKIPDRIGGF